MNCTICKKEIKHNQTTCSRKCSSILACQVKVKKYEKTYAERFWQRVNVVQKEQCWEWQAGKTSEGYGTLKHRGRALLAHRESFRLFYGGLHDDICVLHVCDNPPCVNPYHLFTGTRYDNNRDRVEKGRQPKHNGSKNPNSKLTFSEIEKIRELYSTGLYKQKDLANMFGVNQPHISRIIRRKAW